MARGIYETEPVFRGAVDQCCQILQPSSKSSCRRCYIQPKTRRKGQARITETILAQPAIFAVSYALAQLWLSWGIRPTAILGHSVGEFVGACLADVFSLEDALQLVVARGRLMQSLPRGGHALHCTWRDGVA